MKDKHAAIHAALFQNIARFMNEMRDVDAGRRISTEDDKAFAGAKPRQRLPCPQHRQRAFQPSQIQFFDPLGHAMHIDRLTLSKRDGE